MKPSSSIEEEQEFDQEISNVIDDLIVSFLILLV